MKEIMLILISIAAACAVTLVYGHTAGIPSGEDIVTVPQFIGIVGVFLIPVSFGYLVGRLTK